VFAPPTNLYELVAFLRRAHVLVAADTGPLHLAAALGTPCVGLYGPTSAVRNGPYGTGHRCLQGPGGRVTTIEVDAVLHAVADLLA
jgi:ADP-heptose:LPS heptosyltransferase